MYWSDEGGKDPVLCFLIENQVTDDNGMFCGRTESWYTLISYNKVSYSRLQLLVVGKNIKKMHKHARNQLHLLVKTAIFIKKSIKHE